ncbi:hypothetical protein ACIP5L_24000 [Streptomyces bacillaris]|uniref:hypothetical protein n=1 Tax=Streptomyces bacillaris TaxID=68179 RepID=UPI003824E379
MSEFEPLDRKERALHAEAELLDKESAGISRRQDVVEANLQRVADARAILERLSADDPTPCPEPEQEPVEPGADGPEQDDGRAAGREPRSSTARS